MSSLRTSNLKGGYSHHAVFEDLELSLPKGKFIALTGPNGSGKSTLLKFFYKQLKPEAGAVYLDGKNISTLSQSQLARKLALVPQNGSIAYAFSVAESVHMGQFAITQERSFSLVERAMEQCDISHLAEKKVTELSGGELQRVLLARALCQHTDILLLDEPVNHLDVGHQLSIMKLLKSLVKEGYTVVCVLHDLMLVQIFSDESIVLNHGKIVATGSTEQIFDAKLLSEVYHIDAHQVEDSTLQRKLWVPTWI